MEKIHLQQFRPPVAVRRAGAGRMIEGAFTLRGGGGVGHGALWGCV